MRNGVEVRSEGISSSLNIGKYKKSNYDRGSMQLSAGRGYKVCGSVCLVCGVLESDE